MLKRGKVWMRKPWVFTAHCLLPPCWVSRLASQMKCVKAGKRVSSGLHSILQPLPHLGCWPCDSLTHILNLSALLLMHEGNSFWIYLTFFLPRDSFQSQKHAESMHRAGSQAPVSPEKVRVAEVQVNWQTKASTSLPLVWNTSGLVLPPPHGPVKAELPWHSAVCFCVSLPPQPISPHLFQCLLSLSHSVHT